MAYFATAINWFMLRVILFVLLLLSIGSAYAQVDTVYFDKKWKKCKKDIASYYRIAKKLDNGQYNVEDHYMTGQIQMKGINNYLDSSCLDGPVFYYDSLGNVDLMRTFENGVFNGHTKFYNNDLNKNLHAEGDFVNGKLNGVWKYYYDDGPLLATDDYRDGEYLKKSIWYNRKGFVEVIGDHNKYKCYTDDGTEFTYNELSNKAQPPFRINTYLEKKIGHSILTTVKKKMIFNVSIIIDTNGKVSNVNFFRVKKVIEELHRI